MSSEDQLVTPKTKKRVRQLITFYEEIGTPGRTNNGASGEQPVPEVDETPSKKAKLREEFANVAGQLEHVLSTEGAANENETPKKESRSARKSRRMKEATLAKYSKRMFCATEVLSTERSYVEGLQHLHKVRNGPFKFLALPPLCNLAISMALQVPFLSFDPLFALFVSASWINPVGHLWRVVSVVFFVFILLGLDAAHLQHCA